MADSEPRADQRSSDHRSEADMTPGRYSAAVLVGGASRRMGRDKAVVEVDGHPMALRVIDALGRAGVRSVVTIGGSDRGFGVTHLEDQYPGEGPLGGLLTALQHAPTELVFVVACDMPWVTRDVFRSLMQQLGDSDVALAYTDRLEPLCALWRAPVCLGALERAFSGGERAVHRALSGLGVVEVAVDASALRNVNTPGDLE